MRLSEFNISEVVDNAIAEHIKRGVPFTECMFRPGSEAFTMFYRAVREMREDIDMDWFDREMLDTDIGECVEIDGEIVPLDVPIEDLTEDHDDNKLPYDNADFMAGFIIPWTQRPTKDYQMPLVDYVKRNVPDGNQKYAYSLVASKLEELIGGGMKAINSYARQNYQWYINMNPEVKKTLGLKESYELKEAQVLTEWIWVLPALATAVRAGAPIVGRMLSKQGAKEVAKQVAKNAGKAATATGKTIIKNPGKSLLAYGAYEVWDTVTDAMDWLEDIGLDGALIPNTAKVIVKYGIPAAAVFAALYGGKKLYDYIKDSNEKEENEKFLKALKKQYATTGGLQTESWKEFFKGTDAERRQERRDKDAYDAMRLDELTAKYEKQGLAPGKARRQAYRDVYGAPQTEEGIDEAEYQGKKVKLNSPKRGGSKKFYVYVKNPKTGRVKKISWGDTTGLSVKAKNRGAVRSFVARHKCKQANDKLTARYWSCRTPRYKALGVKGGAWW